MIEPTDREYIFGMINQEREYQDNRWGPGFDKKNTVAHFLTYMEKHIAKAKDHLYKMEEVDARIEVRKLAALAVACMEYHETKPRE